MKIKQFFKKAAATVMAAVTVLSLLPTTAFAATGDVGTISFTRTYDSAGNAMYYNSSAVINGYTAGGTGKNKYRMYVDGSTAFCMDNRYALLFIRGERPVMDEKYNPLKHPNVALTALGGAPTYEHGKTDHVTATISIGTVTESEPPEPETAVDDTMELLSNEEIEALFHLI